MLISLLADPWRWVAAVAVLVVCLALTRRLLFGAVGASSKRSDQRDELATAHEEYPDLSIPLHKHCELALDPPTGMHISNPREPYSFDNEFAYGKYIFFHSPTCAESEGAGSLDYRDYFKGKKRAWEIRLEIHFKTPPPPEKEIFFGIEMEKYTPFSDSTKRVVSVAVTAIRKAISPNLYQSPGDDPSVVQGELEKPVFVLPLWAFDQFIETPEGEEPPSLTDIRFPNLGKKRYQRINEFIREIDELKAGFRTGPTYTLGFWGVSRFLDALNWSLVGIPLITPLDFDVLVNSPPVFAVIYTLDAGADPEDKRHLQSRKHFIFRAAIWSSVRRPARARFEALTGASILMRQDTAGEVSAPATLRQRATRAFMASVTCCSATGRR